MVYLADELEEALQAAAGAVVIATHDRWLRRKWQGRELPLTPYEPLTRTSWSPGNS